MKNEPSGHLTRRMETMKITRWLLALGVASAACSNATDSGQVVAPPGSLNYLRLAPTAPTLCSNTVTFDAIKGTRVEGALVFPEPGDDCNGSTEDFVRLRIDAQSLLEMPDGTPINDGDHVTITMTWVGGDSIMVELEPTGLVFDPKHPARLKIEYDEASDDLNHDGNVDQADDDIEQELGMWRQAAPGDDFVLIGTIKLEDENEIEAKLNGFSRYAIAY